MSSSKGKKKNAGVKGMLFGEERYGTPPKNGQTPCLDTASKDPFLQNLICFLPGNGVFHNRMVIMVLHIFTLNVGD